MSKGVGFHGYSQTVTGKIVPIRDNVLAWKMNFEELYIYRISGLAIRAELDHDLCGIVSIGWYLGFWCVVRVLELTKHLRSCWMCQIIGCASVLFDGLDRKSTRLNSSHT